LFKSVNDEHGHLGGDFTLRELAACVRSVIRKEELFARYGGEEFVVVLPECRLEGGVKVADRIRAIVESHSFQFEGKSFRVTISLGVATTTGDDSLTPTELVRQADVKLYQAKRAGRNR